MKNTSKFIIAAFACGIIAAFILGCTGGCSTTGNPAAQILTPANLTLAADIATVADLQSRPSDWVYFQSAKDLLSSYANGSNTVSYGDIQTAMNATGSTNQLASAVISALIPQIESYASQAAGTNTSQTSAELKAGTGAIATGIGEGLTASGH
jgi:hypothetical protein